MGYFIIQMELPAVCKEDIEITSDGQRLNVVGPRPHVDRNGAPHPASKHGPGRFHVVIEIPAEFDVSRARPAYQSDVLRVVIPRRKQESEDGRAMMK